ncbi:methyltransferase domain-containing protein [Candidatus Woesearchaeota archaeon]|nr:methyltransferase domain-containing protein [Candidatus Woesearchaeota archaeon]
MIEDYVNQELEKFSNAVMDYAEEAKDKGVKKYIKKVNQWMREGKNPFKEFVLFAQEKGASQECIKNTIDRLMEYDLWEWSPEEYFEKKKIAKKASKKSNEKDYQDIGELLDKDKDGDLRANWVFLDENIQKEFGYEFGAYYRATIEYEKEYGEKDKQETSSDDERAKLDRYLGSKKPSDKNTISLEDSILSEKFKGFIKQAGDRIYSDPRNENEEEIIIRLRKLIRKKAHRDSFSFFKENPEKALEELESIVKKEDNRHINYVYNELIKDYRGYTHFKLEDVNPEFKDPDKGIKGVLPSLHQIIALYHAIEKESFGVLDHCGTGKTFIGTMFYYLAKKKKETFKDVLELMKKHNLESLPDYNTIKKLDKSLTASIDNYFHRFENLEEKFKRLGKEKNLEEKLKNIPKVEDKLLVIGTVPCLETWKKAFTGEGDERYTEKRYKLGKEFIVVNGNKGDPKDELLRRKLEKAKVVFVNYQQLVCDFDTAKGKKKVYEVLENLGFDAVIMDEVHNIKKKENSVKKKDKEIWTINKVRNLMKEHDLKNLPDYDDINDLDEDLFKNIKKYFPEKDVLEKKLNDQKKSEVVERITLSGAARRLAFKTDYRLLLSGTPMPDNITDYAMIYHLIRPDKCPDPTKFERDILRKSHYNPRELATFIDENTIRRTSEEVLGLEAIDKKNMYVGINMTEKQKRIDFYIRTHSNGTDMLDQLRKCYLDPRLVDPRILKKTGLLGKITIEDSAKYKRLEQLLLDEDGPLKKGEKFVIFSSEFKQGVTRKVSDKANVKQQYISMGLEKEYRSLRLKETLEKKINRLVGKFGKKIEIIDGEVRGQDDEYKELEKRERITRDFRKKDENTSLLCTTKAGGESLNLSCACHCYFLDEDWSPATTDQAIARLWRKGQKKKVDVKFLRLEDSMEPKFSKYVDKKRIAIKVMLDGQKLSKEEIDMLSKDGSEGRSRVIDMIRQSTSGIPEDFSKVDIYDTSLFKLAGQTRRSNKKKSKSYKQSDIVYETTESQKIRQLMAIYKSKVWEIPEFAELYTKNLMNLSVYPLHRAKICDLVDRAIRGEIEFPKNVLSEGSGPSILYNAYNDLEKLIAKNGFKVPSVTDRDKSEAMLRKGNSDLKNMVVGDMRGIGSRFEDEQFDMVDNASSSLLKNRDEVKECLLEANRILKPDGLLELTIPNLKFKEKFYDSLKDLGFEILSTRNQRFVLSPEGEEILKSAHSEHFVNAYKSAIKKAQFVLAKKICAPKKNVKAEHLWFCHPNKIEYEESDNETIPEKAKKEITELLDEGSEKKPVAVNKKMGLALYNLAEEEQVSAPKREAVIDNNLNLVAWRKIGNSSVRTRSGRIKSKKLIKRRKR